jgi:hypothetical protein
LRLGDREWLLWELVFTTGGSFLWERAFKGTDWLLREPAYTREWLQQEPVFTTGDAFLRERAFAGTVWLLSFLGDVQHLAVESV